MYTTIDYKDEAAIWMLMVFVIIGTLYIIFEPFIDVWILVKEYVKIHILDVRILIYTLATLATLPFLLPLLWFIGRQENKYLIAYMLLAHSIDMLLTGHNILLQTIYGVLKATLIYLFGASS
ncbi:MAG: hypothetical protein IE880_06485 [Epsilonproteobacteria bacterium]|nr:hypothetical protein [Campylobacterota bacterium]